MPKIYDALKMEGSPSLTLEVQQQLGDGVVRTIALGSSDGLRRGMKVKTPARRSRCRSARRRSAASWTCSATRSTSAARSTPKSAWLDPPQGAGVRRAVAVDGAARDRHQGDRPRLPVRQGRQGRPVRRRRRRQDREHDGADQQHRQGSTRACRCSPAWASAPARATTSTTR